MDISLFFCFFIYMFVDLILLPSYAKSIDVIPTIIQYECRDLGQFLGSLW